MSWLRSGRLQRHLLTRRRPGRCARLQTQIVYDDAREAVRRLPAPVVLVGSAGFGQTAVTLAKGCCT